MSSRPFPSPASDEVIGALERTGYLLEQRVASKVRSAGFTTITGKAFMDPDEGKSREIDIFAVKKLWEDSAQRIVVSLQLVIECKRSDGPYVALGRDPEAVDKYRQPHSHTMPVEFIRWLEFLPDGAARQRGMQSWGWLGFHELPGSPNLDIRKGLQLIRMNLRGKEWVADNSSIFESLTLPLMKAVEAFRPQRDRNPEPKSAHLCLSFPIVVTSGELFYVNGESETPISERTDWVSLERDVDMRSMKGLFNLDVVAFPALERYLQERVLLFSEAVVAKISQEPEKLKKRELDARQSGE
ncbi:hypothetical protein [Streptomyces sp. AM 2-1-1]|uniref:hypothetical protein n=1 Tax=Streptomyces sp. AM 2-1-1 TaxID=3028709 RepID=UPI0023B99BEA|nr:hypothetical protein [Streptomyces sp. AM 2-1-1]WEH40594.1 hypothetical protein PZB77_14355 [Streptomyces sp. AM 2-1-1]